MRRAVTVAVCAAAVAILVVAPALAGDSERELLGTTTWNPLNRTSAGHFRVADPADVAPEEAEAVYRALVEEMAATYALSGNPIAARYRWWPRYNTTPYRSVTHGKRYLNNYANDAAKAYGRYEEAGPMPPGAVIAKDSFSVSNGGEVLPGPLFLMEKMEPGFNPDSGDWRYTMILPDGSVLGTTKGENADNVAFCAPCHADAREGDDHLFFLPRSHRLTFAGD